MNKRIYLSILMLVLSILLMICFYQTDQGKKGKLLGLDGPVEEMATGWPLVLGSLSLLLFIIGIIAFVSRHERN